MRFLFQITDGPRAGNKFLLRANTEMIVGRTELADYAVPGDFNMSSRHFCLRATDAGCSVQDMDSTNGTLVNGQPISRIDLSDGDRITAGSSDFQLCCEQPTMPPPSTPPVTRRSPPVEPAPREHVPPVREPAPSEEVTPAYEEPVVSQVASRSDVSDVDSTSSSPIADPLLSPETTPPPLPDATPSLQAEAPATPLPEATPFRSPEGPPLRANVATTDTRSEWPFESALQDPEPVVRRAALFAAAVTGREWVLDHCRTAAASPSRDDFACVLLLAILGEPQDLTLIERILEQPKLGSRRFEVAVSFGNPALLPLLLDLARLPDREASTRAAMAFAAITGYEFPMDGDGDRLDIDAAAEFWSRDEGKFRNGVRWSRGVDISSVVLDEATLSLLDMRSRSDAMIRSAFHGHRQNPAEILGWPGQPLFAEE